jgi:hypothetical protein
MLRMLISYIMMNKHANARQIVGGNIGSIITADNINNSKCKDVINLKDLASSYSPEESDEASRSCQVNNAN